MKTNLSSLRESGFGLIEVVIAAGILAILILSSTSMILNTQKGAQSVERRLGSTELQSFINQILSNTTLCNNSLTGKAAPVVGASVPTLTFAGFNFDDGANNLFENGAIKISSFKYKNVSTSGSTTSAVLELIVSTQGSGTQNIVGGNTLAPVDFPLVATVGGGLITSCGGSSASITSGNTGAPIAVGGGSNCTNPPLGGGDWGVMAAVGANKPCWAYVVEMSGGNSFNSQGCYYDSASGNIYGCSNTAGGSKVTCGWTCLQ